jgi:hypothetical protein
MGPSSPVDKRWRETWDRQEDAMRQRLGKMAEKLEAKAHTLGSLTIGDHVRVQNQAGPKPKIWEKTGVVLENRDRDQVVVRVDGSRRVMLRNRKFCQEIYRALRNDSCQPHTDKMRRPIAAQSK